MRVTTYKATTSSRILCAWLTLAVLFLGPKVRGQSEFGKAHSLLDDLSQVQQQKRDKANAERLSGLLNSVPQEVQQLIGQGILALLNAPGSHSAVEIHQKVAAALQIVPLNQYKPEVFVFPSEVGKQTTYVIAYNITYCISCSRSWIGVVGPTDGSYQVLDSKDNQFPNQSLTMITLEPDHKGSTRFLVYGTNWGDAHNRLNVSLYMLGNGKLGEVWVRRGLPQGSIKIADSKISLTFLTSLTPPWAERTEIYDVLPDRILLRNSSERSDL